MTLDGSRNYLVGERRAVLLDPGPDDGPQGRRIRDLVGSRHVVAVCLTHAHPDHSAGSGAVAADLGAPLAASRATLSRLGLEGRVLEDGDTLSLDGGERRLRVLATPGHSRDHLAFLLLPSRDVFSGDLVLGRGSAMVGHPDGSVGEYLASLRRLASLEPSRIHPGHGPVVEDPLDRLAAYRDHRLEREGQIRAAVEEGARSVSEIREVVYGDLPRGLAGAAESSIRAHLRHLEERGMDLPGIEGREGGRDAGH